MATHQSAMWHDLPWEGTQSIHEHGSDEDAGGNEPLRTRSRSFSEAEDLMNGHSSLSPTYESFNMDVVYSTPSSGLHHRSVTNRSGNGTGSGGGNSIGQGNGSATPGLGGPNGNSNTVDDHTDNWRCFFPSHRRRLHLPAHFPTRYQRYHMSHHLSAKATLKRYFLRCTLVAGLTAYICVFIRGSFLLQREPSKNGEVGPAMFSSARQRFHEEQLLQRQESILKITQRSAERRQRTHPPQTSRNVAPDILSWYEVLSAEQEERNENELVKLKQQQEQTLASVDRLCGSLARNASIVDPHSFKASQALNSESRVLITGILNPLGFNLALHLTQHCGVQTVAGIDSMYPNTLQHRLQLQQRVQVLTTKIPKFVKPILLPFVGLDPLSKKEGLTLLNATGELNLLTFKPTHIVHLASYSVDSYQASPVMDPLWRNSHSPYTAADYDPPLYQLRNTMVSMEQLLMSLASGMDGQPHFLYASSRPALGHSIDFQMKLSHAAAQLVDEILADTYHSLFGVSSIGLRLPNTIYGPWAKRGSLVQSLIQDAIRKWNSTSSVSSSLQSGDDMLDLVFVDDAVDAIIASMQFHTTKPRLAGISSGGETSLASTLAAIKSFRPNSKRQVDDAVSTESFLKTDGNMQPHGLGDISALSQWTPKSSLKDGLLKTIAWQLDQEYPYGPAVETGDALLKRHGVQTCSPEDFACHMGRNYLPCLAECNIKNKCLPSIFDNVRVLVNDITEGCDIIMYTQSLGRDLKDLKLQAEYMDDGNLKSKESLICNFAFVASESKLVKDVIKKVPQKQLAKFGDVSQEGDVVHQRRLDGLNGRLLYRGWILIWVPCGEEELSISDKSLLKLSPGKLFASDVKYAVFVEENFPVSPTIQDVQFLVYEMKRTAFPTRTVRREETIQTEDGEVTKNVHYRLPAEPARRAAILFAPLRYPNIADPTRRQYFDPHQKITIRDATKFMRFEIDEDPNAKEPQEIRRQREYYERVPSYLNRNELRSSFEPWYRYSMRHWVRTRWVVHDMKLEESRQLRCDWYQEHLQWETDLDQLSFAHVMATRELERRIAHHEPDDHIKTFLEQHPALRDLTDSYEWHPMETEHNRLHNEPSKWLSKIPDHFDKDEVSSVDDPFPKHKQADVEPIFVRIMSEKMMAVSRKAWSRLHPKKSR